MMKGDNPLPLCWLGMWEWNGGFSQSGPFAAAAAPVAGCGRLAARAKVCKIAKMKENIKRFIGLLQMHEKLLSEAPKRNVILKISKWNA